VYTLRQLSAADREEFRALRQTALTVSPHDFMLTAAEEAAIPRLAIEAALEQPGSCNLFLGAFEEGRAQLVGIAGLLTSGFLKTRHSGRITSLFVHPAHRRLGNARMLLESLLTQATEGGLRSVRLEVVAENRTAITLYEALGFTPYGREPAAYRLGEQEWGLLLMTRDCA
jgi:ribosomal protein S18 acetylase RimI-like enzyme